MLGTTRTGILPAPAATAAALWLDSWLIGRVGSDDLLAVLTRVAPDVPAIWRRDEAAQPIVDLLAEVRSDGARHCWPLLPRPGRPAGWPRGLDVPAQPAIMVLRAPDPDRAPAGLPVARFLLHAGDGGWAGTPLAEPNAQRTVTGLTAEALPTRAATRRFAELVDSAAADLAQLGLDRAPGGRAAAHWVPALSNLPGSTPPPQASLLHRLAAVLDALDLAMADDGAAVTAREAHSRAARLLALRDDLTDLVTALLVGARSIEAPPAHDTGLQS